MTEPRLLTVLLNYRTADMTMKAAQSAVTAMQGLDAEMVIVDNDSGDGSFEALSEFVAGQDWLAIPAKEQSQWCDAGCKQLLHLGALPTSLSSLRSKSIAEPYPSWPRPDHQARRP